MLVQANRPAGPDPGTLDLKNCDGVVDIRFKYRQVFALACALIATLAIAAPASAADCPTSVTLDQYGDRTEQFDATHCTPKDPPDPGTLPFTGLDVGLMAGAAGVLLAGGVMLRRRGRAEQGL